MKLRTLLLFITALITISIGAQTYEISKISQDTLLAGENTLIITLNKEIVDFDSIVVSVNDGNGQFGYWHQDYYPSWTDSTITASIPVPPYISSRDISLSIFMVNRSTFDYASFDYSEALYIKHIPYEIISISPDTLRVGSNKVTLTFDRKIEYYDSILMDFQVPSLGYMGGDKLSWTDSIITASLNIPYAALNMEGTFRLSLHNNTDWTSEEVVDDKPVFVQSTEDAQKFKIQNVEPQNLKPGINILTITLNEEIVDYDSVSVLLDGPSWQYSYWADEIFWSDSTITAKVTIPDDVENLEVDLNVSLIEKAYYIYEDFAYDKPLILAGGIYGISPEICMVSTNESNQHTIVCEPFLEDYIDSVFIYKETQIAEDFEKIGGKAISETPVFVDESSSNAANSNRYKIALKDTSGTMSELGPAHKTMHLTMNVGVKGAINLIWEKYEGFDYSTFHIYRGSSKDNMTKIAEIASNLFTFTDQNPSLFKLYYQVVIEKPDPCDISMQKSTASDYASVKSNFVEHTVVNSIADAAPNMQVVNVFPNPVSDRLHIDVSDPLSDTYNVSIHDITGKKIREFYAVDNNEGINLSGIESGIYFVHIQSNTIDETVRIIKK